MEMDRQLLHLWFMVSLCFSSWPLFYLFIFFGEEQDGEDHWFVILGVRIISSFVIQVQVELE